MGLTGTVLLDVAVILLAAQAGGAVARRLRQPPVIGELAAGVVLGPTVLGALPGDPSSALFTTQAWPVVSLLGQLGLVLFIFTVGWDLDTALMRRRSGAAAVVSVASMVPPAALGLLLAVHLHPAHDTVHGEPVGFWPFALFTAAALSMTALPVLARIVHEMRLDGSALATLALSSAALDDLLGWTTLAFALAVVGSGGAWGFAGTVAGSVAFVAVMLLVVRPGLRRRSPGVLAVPLALGCAALTDAIGIHAVFGAFVAGLAMPRTTAGAQVAQVRDRLAPAVALLAPIYFVISGMSVDLPGLRAADIGALALVLVTACAGKFLGAYAGARAAGVGPRPSAALGVLMNTRGLVEIVLLTVGRDAGLIDDRLYTIFVVMALVTTAATPPLLRALRPDGTLAPSARKLPAAPRAA
ncbi:MAG TPA: cation:proton antiporter [Solirubrobacteraceae bacterium]|jgi:Kef-type K+ transport system membrane component KefB